MADTDERQLLAWSYGKLAHMTFNKQEDALQLDRIKLLLMDAEPHPELVKELADALRDIFALMDEHQLVRNVSDDHKPDYAIRMLGFGRRLAKAAAALAKVPHA